MSKATKAIVWLAGIIIVLAVILTTSYFLIEKKIFAMLSDQPGVTLEYSAKSGNLFSGYTLTDLTLRQTESRNDFPPTTFTTPRITVRWRLNPRGLTEISWDEGNLRLMLENGGSEDIRIGEGALLPGDAAWLESGSDIMIGPDSWNGKMTVRIRQDVQEIRANVDFNRIPSRMISLFGESPMGFVMPDVAILEMDISGTAGRLEAHGTVSDPLTRRSYRF